jgi:predicted N-acyltransferase
MPKQVLVVFAREKGAQKPIAGAFNLVSDNALFGRYWGAREDRPFLHFNVCYYAGVQACIERGLSYFEPGAGGEHKHARGFESTITHSVHYLRDVRLRGPVERFLDQERAAIREGLESEKPILKLPESLEPGSSG